MSVLSETTIQISKETIQLFAISNSALNPSIAICTKSRVLLYNDQGEKHDYELARNQTPTAIEWHPNAPTLAIGWQNGKITRLSKARSPYGRRMRGRPKKSLRCIRKQ